MRELFAKKCASKKLTVPSTADLLEVVHREDELRSEWENMLARQLPVLPALDNLLARFSNLLRWIDEPSVILPEVQRASAPISAQETVVAPAGIQYWGGGAPLETIRFAGANRLLVEFTYHSRHRRVEPYSLRRAQTGNLLFYGWEQGSAHIKAFNTAKMSAVHPTNVSFQPRFRVEFTPHGPLSAPRVGKYL